MTGHARILAFAGSAREGSYNKKLARVAADAARAAGARVTLVDLRDFELPIYNGDIEATDGLPERALALKELFAEHQGLLIAAPEYNSSVTPLLKNTLDWVSRRAGDEAPLAAFKGKVGALVSASPGRLGGLRGLAHLRQILTTLGVLVVAEQTAVPDASHAFDESGALKDPAQRQAVEAVARRLAETVAKLCS